MPTALTYHPGFKKKATNKKMPTKKESTSDTFRTTESMQRKANVLARLYINILKVFRICCPNGKKRKKHGNDTSVQQNVA